jgi:hypothetical protein
MGDPIAALLRSCCVRLPQELGTGCFVTEQLIVTCAHNIPEGKAIGDNIEIYKGGRLFSSTIKVLCRDYFADYCILELIDGSSDHYILLDDLSLTTNEPLYGDGFPVMTAEQGYGNFQHADGFSAKYESAPVFEGYDYPLYKMKAGQIKGGFSGAPVIRMNNGRCIGIVISTRNDSHPAGGHVISASLLLEQLRQ